MSDEETKGEPPRPDQVSTGLEMGRATLVIKDEAGERSVLSVPADPDKE